MLAPPQGGRTHPPPRRTLQIVEERGVPWVELKDPPWMKRWMCLVDISQHMWRTGDIPQDLGCKVLHLIPKGTTNTWSIGLLDTLWKLVEALIDNFLCAILQLHDILHGLRAKRETVMAIMELKIAQELVVIYQYPLFLVFLDLRKAYDTVY